MVYSLLYVLSRPVGSTLEPLDYTAPTATTVDKGPVGFLFFLVEEEEISLNTGGLQVTPVVAVVI